MSHRWMRTFAAPAAAAALALGAAACEVEDGGLDPGLEDPAFDDGGVDGLDDGMVDGVDDGLDGTENTVDG